jgi:hypothetical protein
MSKYQLKIEKPSVDGTTGHHTILVHIIELTDSNQTIAGIKETYAIESTALDLKFGGDIQKWLQWVGQEMLTKHVRRTQSHMELISLNGKTIDLDPQEKT